MMKVRRYQFVHLYLSLVIIEKVINKQFDELLKRVIGHEFQKNNQT